MCRVKKANARRKVIEEIDAKKAAHRIARYGNAGGGREPGQGSGAAIKEVETGKAARQGKTGYSREPTQGPGASNQGKNKNRGGEEKSEGSDSSSIKVPSEALQPSHTPSDLLERSLVRRVATDSSGITTLGSGVETTGQLGYRGDNELHCEGAEGNKKRCQKTYQRNSGLPNKEQPKYCPSCVQYRKWKRQQRA